METTMKFDHDAESIHESIGYTEDQFDTVLDKANDLVHSIKTNPDGHQPSRLIELFVNSNLSRLDLAVVICQALRK